MEIPELRRFSHTIRSTFSFLEAKYCFLLLQSDTWFVCISGVLVSVLRIITKAVMPQNNSGIVASAYLYFSVSAVLMVACVVGYNVVEKLPVMQHYKKVRTTTIEPTFWTMCILTKKMTH